MSEPEKTEPEKIVVSTPVVTPVPDYSEGFKVALKKHGDDMAGLARKAFDDAEGLRRENAELRGKLPVEGAVVLHGEPLTAYQELLKLGTPSEIRSLVEQGSEALTEANNFRREKLLAEAAEPYGFVPKVLAKLAGADLAIEIKDGPQRMGRTTKVAEVVTTTKDDKGADVIKRTPLDKYAQDTWPEFLPSLRGQKATLPGGSPPDQGGMPRPQIQPVGPRRSLVR